MASSTRNCSSLRGNLIRALRIGHQYLQLRLTDLLLCARNRAQVFAPPAFNLRDGSLELQHLRLCDEVLFKQRLLAYQLFGNQLELNVAGVNLSLNPLYLLVELFDALTENILAGGMRDETIVE